MSSLTVGLRPSASSSSAVESRTDSFHALLSSAYRLFLLRRFGEALPLCRRYVSTLQACDPSALHRLVGADTNDPAGTSGSSESADKVAERAVTLAIHVAEFSGESVEARHMADNWFRDASLFPAEVVLLLINADLRAGRATQAQDLVETWLARASPLRDGYARIVEDYILRVLPATDNLETARSFLQMADHIPPEARAMYEQKLHELSHPPPPNVLPPSASLSTNQQTQSSPAASATLEASSAAGAGPSTRISRASPDGSKASTDARPAATLTRDAQSTGQPWFVDSILDSLNSWSSYVSDPGNTTTVAAATAATVATVAAVTMTATSQQNWARQTRSWASKVANSAVALFGAGVSGAGM